MATKRGIQGRGHVRQRPDGRWEGMYQAGHDYNGKRIQRSVYGKTQSDVVDKLDAILGSIKKGAYCEPSKLILAQWLDIWCEEHLDHVKPRTRENYKNVCKNHIKPGLGTIKLTELKAPAIKRFYNALKKETKYKDKNGNEKVKKGLSPKTIRNVAGVLHEALEVATDEEHNYIPKNPASSVKLPKNEKPKIFPLDEDGFRAFMDAVSGHRLEYLFTTALLSGMRQGELLGLQWGSIDFERGTIRVDKQLQRNDKNIGGGLDTTKHEKIRQLHVAPSVLSALWEQRRRQAEWKLLAGPLWNNKDDLCFTNETGGILVHGTVSHTFKRIITAVGYPDTRFHDLRHSYAVASLASGADIKSIQDSLGHHSAAFTLDTYAHSTEQMKKDSANKLESFVQNIMKSS